MATRLTMLGLLLALVLSTSAVATGAIASTSSSSSAAATSETCDQTATHDAFRTDEAIQVVNETGEATSTARNTEVRVEDVPGFVRLHATNPNGYCVAITVEISSEIVAPADLGTVDSTDEQTEASWRAIQNLSSGQLYTQVEFVLPPGGNATFAPSTVRVRSLSWTGEAKNKTGGLFDGLPSVLGGEDDLEERQYEIQPQNGEDAITVPLQNEDGREIKDWQATYTVDGQTRPITQDAGKPVYYSETGDSVTFHFNDEDATVSFTANPKWHERRTHEWESYSSGWGSIGDWLPLVATPGRVA